MRTPNRIHGLMSQGVPRTMGSLILATSLGLGACTTTTDEGGDEPPPTVAPGATLPLGSTVRVDTNGIYQLPAGATSLRTRCFGRVTVIFTPPGGPEQSNTCESAAGSGNQTNDVTGVASVRYDLDPGAFGDVTVN